MGFKNGKIEVLTTEVRYYYIDEDFHENGRAMRRDGAWASLVKDGLYNEEELRDVNKELWDDDDMHNNRDVSGSRWSSLRIPVTMLYFHNSEVATEVCMFLKDLDFPSIPHVIAKVDDTTVVVEKIPEMLFMEWLKSPTEPMWTQDSTGTKCLELNGRYSNIFRCIVATLTYLHSRGKCHGNLKNGIFVTGQEEDHRIGFTNFNIKISFETGLKRDLKDLESLMITAFRHAQPIEVNGHNLPEPPALKSFYHLFKELELNPLWDFEKYRDFATFIYWAPIFYNWRDRKDFFNIVEQFSLQDNSVFVKLVVHDDTRKPCTCTRKKKEDLIIHTCKNHAIPSMNGWVSKVSPSATPLWRVLTYIGKIPEIYKNSGGIYQLHRNCLHHYKGKVNKDSSQCAMEDLLNQFPDAIPAIFKALIDKFYFQPSGLLGKSLTAFLKEAKRSGGDN